MKRAQDELRRYSRDLERQVRERTRAINSILRYTPAVVYLKDRMGHYRLVNPRYEELFGIKNEEIQGKSDHDIFPPEVADQFRTNDLHGAHPKALAPGGGAGAAQGRRPYLSVGEISPV